MKKTDKPVKAAKASKATKSTAVAKSAKSGKPVKGKKYKSISAKLLSSIMPAIIIAMVVLTVISANTSRNIIQNQINGRMDAELAAQKGLANEQLNAISSMASTLSHVVANNYKTTRLGDYMDMMCDIVDDNDTAYGAGIWFDAYLYDPNQQYTAPYVYKAGGVSVSSYDNSGGRRDYLSESFFVDTKSNKVKECVFTPTYYDAKDGKLMTTCVSPIYLGTKFIGVTTVDVRLDVFADIISANNEGSNLSVILVAEDGTYIAGVDDAKLADGAKITEDENASLAKAGEVILTNAEGKGTTSCTIDGAKYNVYYEVVDATGWRFLMMVPGSELTGPVQTLIIELVAVCIVALVMVVLIIIHQIRNISKSIDRVKRFAGSLAEGDFTVEPINMKTRDELGIMGDSLNEMYTSNRGVISGISDQAVEIDEASRSLKNAAAELSQKFDEIQSFMVQVNEAMVNTSSATQQVNASTEEVLSNVNLLANETNESSALAQEIRGRASKIRTSSQEAFDSATKLGHSFENNLHQSIENAKVVSSIGQLADVISEIAEQINLLSLNASIEAARAGEAGRGFAVVAAEIGSLAGNTSEAVKKIQDTVNDVQKAFAALTEDAKEMLGFLVDTVTPDYQNFVQVAEQYGMDAEAIENSSANISHMSESIKNIMQEVTDAIQNIAEATHSTSDISGEIMREIDQVSTNVTSVSEMSETQQEIAIGLNRVVGQFTLK